MYRDLAAPARESLDAAMAYVWGVIGDFRLKDLKKQRRAPEA